MKPSVFDRQSSIDIIKDFYFARSTKNRSYSLRAFARDLKISPQVLSNMFHKRHKMSIRRAKEISLRLDFSKDEVEYFLALVEMESCRNKVQKDRAARKVTSLLNQMSLQELDERKHNLLTDAANILCLQMMKVDSYDGNPSFIAERTRLSMAQVENRLKKLTRLGVVEQQGISYWPRNADFKVRTRFSSESVQLFHHQVIKRSLDSIKNQKMNERKLHSTVGAIDQKSYQKILQILEAAQKEVLSEMKNTESRKVVYACSLQFFSMENNTLTALEKSE